MLAGTMKIINNLYQKAKPGKSGDKPVNPNKSYSIKKARKLTEEELEEKRELTLNEILDKNKNCRFQIRILQITENNFYYNVLDRDINRITNYGTLKSAGIVSKLKELQNYYGKKYTNITDTEPVKVFSVHNEVISTHSIMKPVNEKTEFIKKIYYYADKYKYKLEIAFQYDLLGYYTAIMIDEFGGTHEIKKLEKSKYQYTANGKKVITTTSLEEIFE